MDAQTDADSARNVAGDPDAPALAYLRVIARELDMVAKALAAA